MVKAVRLLRRLPPRRALWWAAFALLFLVAATLVWALGPRLAVPPRTITLATGPQGGAYAELGPRYQRALARDGITLRLLPTAGDVENLAKLRDPASGVSAAFVEAGIATEEERANLSSLGTLMYSPLWVFVRGEAQGLAVINLVGKRVAIGPEGSGTRFQFLKLLTLVGVDPRSLVIVDDPPAASERKLLQGDLDALAISTSWDSPLVHRLLADPRVSLVSFPRADAYVALQPTLSKLVVPMGVGDLLTNLPRNDVTVLATKTSLVIREDLHPTIGYLLLEAATEIHGSPKLFQRAGQFPAGEQMDIPLSSDARQFYKSGAPFLHRYFPFWIAVLFERLLILAIPLLGLLYPVLKMLPDLYRKALERRMLALYGELKLLEGEVERSPADGTAATLAQRLDDLEARASRLRLPMSFSQRLYNLREHIYFVRVRLDRLLRETRPSG